jgi:hypothetical protein
MNKLKAVIGITNKTEDNKHIPFFDYDTDDLPNILLDIALFQKKFHLSTAFIVSSTHGYNVFFLDKIDFDGCLLLCEQSRYIDKKFIEYAVNKKNFTLRMGKDKKLHRIISSKNNIFQLSYSHYIFFNDFFKTDILNGIQITDLNFDNLEEIQLVLFMSKKYGYIEVD